MRNAPAFLDAVYIPPRPSSFLKGLYTNKTAIGLGNKFAYDEASLIPRPSPAPIFDCLQYAETEREGLKDLVICYDFR